MDKWISNLFLSPEESNMEIRIVAGAHQQELVVPGHTFVLKAASRVMKELLEQNKIPEGQTRTLQLNVRGTTHDALSFLRYLYQRELCVVETNSYFSVLQSANYYQVHDLVELCEKRIKSALTPFSVCRFIILLDNIASESLITYCQNLMLKFAFLIFKENLHLCLTEEHMNFLLQSDELNVLFEEQAMRALWEWGKTKSSLENVSSSEAIKTKIAGLLPLIRRSLIKITDAEIPWSDLISYSETEEIKNRSHKTKGVSFLDFSIVLNIPSDCIFINDFKTLTRYGTHNIITFTLEIQIVLLGIVIHVSTEQNSEIRIVQYSLDVGTCSTKSNDIPAFHKYDKIKKEYNDKLLWTTHRICSEFEKPVLVQKSCAHNIKVSFDRSSYHNDHFLARSLNSKNLELRSDNFAEGPSVQFCINGPIIAVEKLFYFVM